LKVALISLNQEWEDKPHNLARCEALLGQAASQGAELVIFPEMTLTGFSMNTAKTAEAFEDSYTLESFRQMAIKHRLAIVFGAVFHAGRKAANTLIHMSAFGEIIAQYTKLHPFTFAGEDQFFVHGNALVIAEMDGCKIGYSICYDLRFPEIYSAMAKSCKVIINIANWPKRRVEHWRSLLQARAIENQVFMVGVNRIGRDGNDLEYEKSTYVYDANGQQLVPLLSEPEIDIFEVDIEALDAFKKQFNTVCDRLPALYRSLI